MTTVDTSASHGEHRRAMIAGLRELADFLEANPLVPVPPHPHLTWSTGDLDDEAGVAYVRNLAATLDLKASHAITGHAQVARQFGPVRYGASHAARASMDAYRAALSYDGAVRPETSTSDGAS